MTFLRPLAILLMICGGVVFLAALVLLFIVTTKAVLIALGLGFLAFVIGSGLWLYADPINDFDDPYEHYPGRWPL